jgi:hypothetical protein
LLDERRLTSLKSGPPWPPQAPCDHPRALWSPATPPGHLRPSKYGSDMAALSLWTYSLRMTSNINARKQTAIPFPSFPSPARPLPFLCLPFYTLCLSLYARFVSLFHVKTSCCNVSGNLPGLGSHPSLNQWFASKPWSFSSSSYA